jgi:hypothetical protein
MTPAGVAFRAVFFLPPPVALRSLRAIRVSPAVVASWASLDGVSGPRQEG